MEELQHFSHPHPLALSREKDDDEIFCNGCYLKIFDSAYSCRCCSFFLHKLCAELPIEVTHQLHPEHPLTLLPPVYNDRLFICQACEEVSEAFRYSCSLCDFDLDIICVLKAQIVKHESHKHPLSPVLGPALFGCHACGTKHEGVSYMCNTCRFWIHEDCASLPTTIEHNNHVHPLKLIYTFYGYEYQCNICDQRVNTNFWVYCCKGCKYFVHVNCSTKTKERETIIKVEDLDETNLIRLPVPNESVNLIGQFVKQINLGDSKKEAKLNHFSHNHPLTLFNVESNDEDLCSGSELSILNKQKNDKVCNACIQPIRTSFYNCCLCNFSLHKWCAELPIKLEHPCHQHPLILLGNLGNNFFHCKGCEAENCNGFFFQCAECEDYCLEVKCATLPSSIVHELHEHPLLLRQHCISEGCVACDQSFPIFSFGCGICNFNLHSTCARLPRTISHRYDKHPFTLTYTPIKDGPDEYYCEFCEEEIDPKWWFYHCIDCDQSVCAKCISEMEFPNVKLGGTVNFDSHPHPLTLVQFRDKNRSRCHYCFSYIVKDGIAFKCVQCNILFHAICAYPVLW